MTPTDAQIEMGARAVERYNLGLHGPERRVIADAVLTPVLTDIVARLEKLPHDEFCNVQSRSRGFVCDCAKGEALAVVRGEKL